MTSGVISVPFFMGEQMDGFTVPHRRPTVLEADLGNGTPTEQMARLYRRLASTVSRVQRPLIYAGDCCSIIGVAAGLQRRGEDPTLVFFDAHGDFNTWETTPSGFIGGMPLAMAVGRGEQTIVAGAGMRTLREDRVALIGARALDPGEDEAVASSGLAVLAVSDIPAWPVPRGDLYVHVDVDVVDPSDMPAVNYPSPGGPSLAEVREAVDALVATGRVAALSLSCWNPQLPGADRAAASAAALTASYLLG